MPLLFISQQECLKLNNLNSMMEIVSALGSSPISRLKKSWTDKATSLMGKFTKLLEKNFVGLREIVNSGIPLIIPN